MKKNLALAEKLIGKIKIGGVLSAVGLSFLTLSVFARLQDYGPESTIRKLSLAVKARDEQGVLSSMTTSLSDPSTAGLVNWISEQYDRGATEQIVSLDQKPGLAEVQLDFRFPNGDIVPMIVVVKEINHSWKVDAAASFEAFQNLLTGQK